MYGDDATGPLPECYTRKYIEHRVCMMHTQCCATPCYVAINLGVERQVYLTLIKVI